ncbi:MAG: AsmA family protein [Acidobacteriaceae bacterium]|nr:AsmA family protein [Acidobacteriaceae bacterium]
MRRLMTVLGIAVGVILVLLVVVVSFFNINKFRPRIQAELQSKLNRPVTLGELHLHLFPLSIKVDGLTIGESPAFASAPPFASAKEVYGSADLGSILHGEPKIESLTLQDPQVELIRNAAGVWNFSDIGSSTAASASGKPSSAEAEFTLNQLKILNGQVAVTNERTKSPRTVYNHIDLTVTGFAPGKQFDVDAAVHFPGQGKELLSFHGKAGPVAASGAEATPIDGRLTVEQVSLAGFNSVTGGSIPPNTDAVTSGNADVRSSNGTVSCKGNLTLTNAVIQGARLNYPIESQYDLAFNQITNQINVTSATVKAGPTAVAIAGTVNAGVTPSSINLRLRTNNASIPELMRLASLAGGKANTNTQINGDITADLMATGSIKSPDVQGNVASNKIQAQELVLTNVHATVKMNNGVAQLAPLTAGIFGGQETGTITIDTKPARPPCSINMQFTGVDTNALLSAVSSAKDTLYGSLAAQANLSFIVDSSANLAGTLNGTVNFDVTNGHLKNINILNEVSRIGKFLNAAPVQAAGGTDLKKFSGTLTINHGVATTNNLAAVLDQGSLSGKGSLNLASNAVDMHVNAVLANSISKSVGGTGVGGFLNTALANKQGELVIPVTITGNMSHPVVTPDTQAIAEMKMKNLMPTTGNPSSLVNSLLGGAQQQPGQKNKQQPENPLNSLFNQLGKKH